ncbi:transporter substrate-binding domain-containing protein [Legionella maioricensis]|uniref:Transporter substrate-binding domain-containing protein n=1 Tax=Legionella maioricensis TaxID=2896528 RepID=A0A9X2ID88_9GAMM|nr:transporter substrate-binding domain-containing protein [Legionella maioricensis]MCL9684518.1 transporter substrate-binding domain-containing protein [Legionella maioricensis]MCL9687888.1 transporter substrate-binding domain-containing protein [Legionella maioricensis]
MKALVFIILLISNTFAYSDTLKVGVLKFAPPFSSLAGDGKHFFGFTIDLMDNICQRIQAECSYVSTTVDQHGNALQQGLIDVSFIPVPISAESSESFVFSLPYLASNGQFLTLSDSPIKNLADIKNHKIGVITDTLYTVVLNSPYAKDNDIKKYELMTDLIAALANHKVDVIYVNDSVGKFMVNNALQQFRLVGKKISMGGGYGIMALKNNAVLIQKINKALLNMENDGTYLKIYNRYF